MRRPTAALLATALLVAAAVAGACSRRAAERAAEPWEGPTGPSGPTEAVSIPSLGVTLRVPSGTEVEHVGGGAAFYTQPGARNPRSFSLGFGQPALVHEGPETKRQERTLPGGALIRYTLREATEGSGGTESFLDGAMVVGQQVLAVHCHDQAEAPAKPSAEWCLEWLATVRAAD